MNVYEIADEYMALVALANELTDDNGETRDFTDEERSQFTAWADEIEGNFEDKFNGIYKVYCNFKAQAEIAEAERAALKDEMDRLSKRAKARLNEAGRLKGLIAYAMEILKIKKYKTPLFSIGWQATAKSAKPVEGFFNLDLIPTQYLKRELSPSAIKAAVEDGSLYERDGELHRGKLYYMDGGTEKVLAGVSYLGGETLVVR